MRKVVSETRIARKSLFNCCRRVLNSLSIAAWILLLCIQTPLLVSAQSSIALDGQKPSTEYLWYEAENMRGFATNERGEPVSNPSWMNLTKAQAPGWGMNGPGVSAEWSQGGESEWNSAASSPDETHATIYQDLLVPRSGDYKIWVRYADWANRTEYFTLRVMQGGREVFRQEFGARDIIDSHDEVSMYWGWAFVWDGAPATLTKGPARISLEIERAAGARRHVDCYLITDDTAFVPEGRRKPELPWLRLMREQAGSGTKLEPLIEASPRYDVPADWKPAPVAGRGFLMPWNISKEFWQLYEQPPETRPLYPFSAEPVEEFIKKYKGAREVPIFDSRLVVPVIYLNDLPQLLSEESAFLRYLRQTRAPFAVLINYGSAQLTADQGHAAWKLLTGELKDQFIGWISGESIGYVWGDAATELKLRPNMSRRELLEAHRLFYTRALEKKWGALFHTETGAMWDKLIPALATSSTSFAHALESWGCRLVGLETSAVQPLTAMRLAFNRGAARQYGGGFLYYHAPNFGDTATTYTKSQNFAGPDAFFHSRYGATMGPSLSWYRKSYYLYYMGGASAIYLEQGFDQFFKPGPGEHPFQLNPLGRITDEFMRFAAAHPERGVPYTPVAFLLDPAHGWDMTDYPHWPFGVSQLERGDRALRELFGAAYYPAPLAEGEPATGDRQAFVSGIFGDIFDVLVASQNHQEAIKDYRAVVVGGRIEWTGNWPVRLKDYVREGGVLVLNAAQVKGLPQELLGVQLSGESVEASQANCLLKHEARVDLRGQLYVYERISKLDSGTRPLIVTPTGDPLVTINRYGRGAVIFCALPDLLGEDERLTPFAAHMLAHLFADATPVHVSGEVEYLINRTSRGWIITLFNNRGVYKPQQGLAQVDRRERVQAEVSLPRGAAIKEAREWTSGEQVELTHGKDRDSLKIEIAPGGISIIELEQGPQSR
jgi:hypothetical protein